MANQLYHSYDYGTDEGIAVCFVEHTHTHTHTLFLSHTLLLRSPSLCGRDEAILESNNNNATDSCFFSLQVINVLRFLFLPVRAGLHTSLGWLNTPTVLFGREHLAFSLLVRFYTRHRPPSSRQRGRPCRYTVCGQLLSISGVRQRREDTQRELPDSKKNRCGC